MAESKRKSRRTAFHGLAWSAVLAIAAFVAACSDGGGGSGPDAEQAAAELRASGFGDHLDAQGVSHTTQTGEWTNLFYDAAEEKAVCLTGSPFQVSVRHGTSDQVLLYLQGGGACWDYQTCYVLKTALTEANGAQPIGSLDTANPDSPFKDYGIVYVPYCDGSVFAGDSTVDYSGHRTFHHGLWNLSVAVDAIKANFPSPGRIVVAGSSAGGYGTFAGYGATRVAFPDTPILVFNDSGPGLQNPNAMQDVQDRVKNWNFTDRIPKSCTDCDTQFTFLLNWAFERDAGLRAALYSYQQDSVISFFLDLNGPDYRSLLLDVTGEVLRRDPTRFKRFFPQGTSHTVLQSPEFYSQQISGETVRDWTQAFLDDSSAWTDLVQ